MNSATISKKVRIINDVLYNTRNPPEPVPTVTVHGRPYYVIDLHLVPPAEVARAIQVKKANSTLTERQELILHYLRAGMTYPEIGGMPGVNLTPGRVGQIADQLFQLGHTVPTVKQRNAMRKQRRPDDAPLLPLVPVPVPAITSLVPTAPSPAQQAELTQGWE